MCSEKEDSSSYIRRTMTSSGSNSFSSSSSSFTTFYPPRVLGVAEKETKDEHHQVVGNHPIAHSSIYNNEHQHHQSGGVVGCSSFYFPHEEHHAAVANNAGVHLPTTPTPAYYDYHVNINHVHGVGGEPRQAHHYDHYQEPHHVQHHQHENNDHDQHYEPAVVTASYSYRDNREPIVWKEEEEQTIEQGKGEGKKGKNNSSFGGEEGQPSETNLRPAREYINKTKSGLILSVTPESGARLQSYRTSTGNLFLRNVDNSYSKSIGYYFLLIISGAFGRPF